MDITTSLLGWILRKSSIDPRPPPQKHLPELPFAPWPTSKYLLRRPLFPHKLCEPAADINMDGGRRGVGKYRRRAGKGGEQGMRPAWRNMNGPAWGRKPSACPSRRRVMSIVVVGRQGPRRLRTSAPLLRTCMQTTTQTKHERRSATPRNHDRKHHFCWGYRATPLVTPQESASTARKSRSRNAARAVWTEIAARRREKRRTTPCLSQPCHDFTTFIVAIGQTCDMRLAP